MALERPLDPLVCNVPNSNHMVFCSSGEKVSAWAKYYGAKVEVVGAFVGVVRVAHSRRVFVNEATSKSLLR